MSRETESAAGFEITLDLIERLRVHGLAIVPINPTPEMIRAGWESATDENAELVWRDMIDAAPSAFEDRKLRIRQLD